MAFHKLIKKAATAAKTLHKLNFSITMNIIRFQSPSANRPLFAPLTRLSALSDQMDRLFQTPFFGHGADDGETFAGWSPVVDLLQNKDRIVLRAELPGLRREDIHVSLHEDVLTLSGERRQEKSADERGNLRNERFFGRFKRRLTLPVRVDRRTGVRRLRGRHFDRDAAEGRRG